MNSNSDSPNKQAVSASGDSAIRRALDLAERVRRQLTRHGERTTEINALIATLAGGVS